MVKKDGNLDALREKVDEAKQKLIDLEHRFEGKVKEHPVQSVAVAFGVGMLSGALLAALMKRCK
tara:strand:- start:235 stop:426 length:192 start_codon:yes stop_codon:yes gene_type:complete